MRPNGGTGGSKGRVTKMRGCGLRPPGAARGRRVDTAHSIMYRARSAAPTDPGGSLADAVPLYHILRVYGAAGAMMAALIAELVIQARRRASDGCELRAAPRRTRNHAARHLNSRSAAYFVAHVKAF
jgi:hypothetical protein